MKEGSIEEEGTHNELMGMDFFCPHKKVSFKILLSDKRGLYHSMISRKFGFKATNEVHFKVNLNNYNCFVPIVSS